MSGPRGSAGGPSGGAVDPAHARSADAVARLASPFRRRPPGRREASVRGAPPGRSDRRSSGLARPGRTEDRTGPIRRVAGLGATSRVDRGGGPRAGPFEAKAESHRPLGPARVVRSEARADTGSARDHRRGRTGPSAPLPGLAERTGVTPVVREHDRTGRIRRPTGRRGETLVARGEGEARPICGWEGHEGPRRAFAHRGGRGVEPAPLVPEAVAVRRTGRGARSTPGGASVRVGEGTTGPVRATSASQPATAQPAASPGDTGRVLGDAVSQPVRARPRAQPARARKREGPGARTSRSRMKAVTSASGIGRAK